MHSNFIIEYRQDLRLVISGKEQSRVARVPSRYLGPVPVSIFSSFPISTAMEENIGQPALHRPEYWNVSSLQPDDQRPKNTGGRVALPPGRFESIRKIYGHGLLKTSLKNRFKLCPNSSRCFRTTQIMSRQPKKCPDRLIFCPDSSKYIQTD